ncbi:hypothetical protein GBA65_02515 [Rubrobacter marinus]|uniref:Uncharacterized protein n=1 Tax=Rubrobacter marinus TaxID=2653852 RepID=A0A6G8PUQ4_9ACTN|nr:hypothetical protein [Rubrobacter marinus]QIN77565.1 hypothetical protein GBA65_02515 [Rubrobacter marinus]
MIYGLLRNEEANTAVVLALGTAIVALVANGSGSPKLGRILSGALSNPVPRSLPRVEAAGVPAPEHVLA